MIICKRLVPLDDSLQEANPNNNNNNNKNDPGDGGHQGDRGEGTEGGEEGKEEGGGEEEILADGQTNQSKVVQEILADIKRQNQTNTINWSPTIITKRHHNYININKKSLISLQYHF